MLTNLFKAALFGYVQRWISTPASSRNAVPSPIHLNSDELKALAIRIGSLVTLSFLNFLLFVGALIVTVVAVAHSYDVYDRFVATSVFWTGLIMGFTALVIGGISGYALLNTKMSFKDFIITEPVVEPQLALKDRIVMPFFEGLAEGFRRGRRPAEAAYDRDFPAA